MSRLLYEWGPQRWSSVGRSERELKHRADPQDLLMGGMWGIRVRLPGF